MDYTACQALLSMGLPRQEYWSRLPFSSPGHLPNPGLEPMNLALAGGFFTTEPPGKTLPISQGMNQLIYGLNNRDKIKPKGPG